MGARAGRWAAAAVAVVLGPACAMSAANPERIERDAALRAIEALHRRDMEATRRNDADALVALWSEDIVALPPQGPIQRDRARMEAELRTNLERSAASFETLQYDQDFTEIEVLGDHAWELGTFTGRVRNRATGEITRYDGKLLRILRRTPAGEWKVHRTIWNQVLTTADAR